MFWEGLVCQFEPESNRISIPWYRWFALQVFAMPLAEDLSALSNQDRINGHFGFHRFAFFALFARDGQLFFRIRGENHAIVRESMADYVIVNRNKRVFRFRDQNDRLILEARYSLSQQRLDGMKYPDYGKVESDYDFFMFVASSIADMKSIEWCLHCWKEPRVEFAIRNGQLFLDNSLVSFDADVVEFLDCNSAFVVRLDASQTGEQNIVALNDDLKQVWIVECAPSFEGAPKLTGYSKISILDGRLIATTWRGQQFELDLESGKIIKVAERHLPYNKDAVNCIEKSVNS